MHPSIHALFDRVGITPHPPEALMPLLENRRVTDEEFIDAFRYMYLHSDWRAWITERHQLNGQRSLIERDRLCTQMLDELKPFLRGAVNYGRLAWWP